jgi:hypothetical protein
MIVRKVARGLFTAAIFLHLGCAQTGSTPWLIRWFDSWEPPDYTDAEEETQTEWESIGKQARHGRPIEKDPDPWWKEYVMSEKARSIERSVGVE